MIGVLQEPGEAMFMSLLRRFEGDLGEIGIGPWVCPPLIDAHLMLEEIILLLIGAQAVGLLAHVLQNNTNGKII